MCILLASLGIPPITCLAVDTDNLAELHWAIDTPMWRQEDYGKDMKREMLHEDTEGLDESHERTNATFDLKLCVKNFKRFKMYNHEYNSY